MCEQMWLVDLRYRGFKRVDAINYTQRINITDAMRERRGKAECFK